MVDRFRGLGLALLLAGCAAPSTSDPVPARLVDPSAETRAQLRQAVQSALGSPSVTLSPDALTRSSLLVIERAPPRTGEGRLATGRVLEGSDRFRLVRAEGRCVLVHLETETRYPLPGADCIPEDN